MRVCRARIGEILKLSRESIAIEADREYRRIGILSWGKGFLHRPLIRGVEMGSMRYFTLPEGALVLSNIQSWEAAVAVSGPSERDHVASNRFLPYVPRDSEVDVRYLRHYFLSQDGLAKLRSASPGTQVRNRTLGKALFEAIEVPLPEFDEQRRIADHLDSLERYGQAATSGLHRRAELLALIADGAWSGAATRIGDLVQPVSRLCQVAPDQSYRMQGVRWYGAGLFTREIRKGTELAAETVYAVEPGDLVYNRLFAWKRSFAIAEDEGYVSNEFPVFAINEGRVHPRVLLALLVGREFTLRVNEASSGSTPTSRNRLKVQDFLNLRVQLPSVDDQHRIGRLLAMKDKAEPFLRRASALSAALVPAARNEVFSRMR